MALVNPNIAMSFRQPDIQAPNALAQFAQIQQIQGGRQAQELNALKMQEAQAAMQERNALRQLNPADPDYENQLSRVNPTLGIQYRKERIAAEASGAATAASRAAASTSEFELKAKQRKFLADLKRELTGNPSDENIISFGQDAVLQGLYTPEQAQATVQQLLAIPAANRQQIFSQFGASAAELRPQVVAPGGSLVQGGKAVYTAPAAPEAAKLADRFVPVGRLVFDRETQQYISPSQAQLTQSQERAAAPQGAGKAPSGYRFTSAGDLEAIPGGPASQAGQPKLMTPVQAAKRRDQLGKEFKSAQNALQTTQDVLDSINFVKSEPGLSRATGFTGTLLPSFPEGAAASAETRLKNLEGKITALGKAQAASTGAIGSIANQEWQILANQIAAIDRTKGTGPLLKQLELVEAQAQGTMEKIKDGYQRQFGEDFEQFPQFADLPVPRTTFKPRAPAGGKPAAGGATGGWSVVR
jgi:hypothetical protein